MLRVADQAYNNYFSKHGGCSATYGCSWCTEHKKNYHLRKLDRCPVVELEVLQVEPDPQKEHTTVDAEVHILPSPRVYVGYM